MNCGGYQRLAALDGSAELTPRLSRRLHRHMAACAACREMAESVAGLPADLAGLEAGDIDEGALVRARSRALGRIQTERRPARLWPWLLPIPAAAALAFLLLTPRVPAPPAAVVHNIAPPAQWDRRTASVVRPRPRRSGQTTKNDGLSYPLVIRLATSDPDVVIYWTVEGKGD